MARISFSPLVEEIVGKLAGSVFQDSYGGFQIRTRVSPRNPQTKYQQLRRGEFGFLSASWRGLSPTERQTFIDNATSPGAALNLFLQANVNLTLIEEPTITTYVPSADPGTMQIEFDTAEEGSLTVKATGSPLVVPAGTKLLLQVTYQKAPTKIFTNPSQYSPVISFDEGTDLTNPVSILTEWQNRYGVLLPDKRFCLSSALIDKSNGLRGATLINCTTVNEMPLYESYNARLSQAGASAPTEVLFRNSIGTITLSRIGTGQFGVNSANLFTVGKTEIFINGFADGFGNAYMQAFQSSASQIVINNLNAANLNVDGFTDMDIEVRLWP